MDFQLIDCDELEAELKQKQPKTEAERLETETVQLINSVNLGGDLKVNRTTTIHNNDRQFLTVSGDVLT